MKKHALRRIMGCLLAAAMLITAVPVGIMAAEEISVASESANSEILIGDAVSDTDDQLIDEVSDADLSDDNGPVDDLTNKESEADLQEGDQIAGDLTDEPGAEIPVNADGRTSDEIVSSNSTEAEDPEGYIFADETKYWLTFAIEYNGEVKEIKYENTVALDASQTLASFLGAANVSRVRTFTEYGFPAPETGTAIRGWRVNLDGRDFYNSTISADLSTVLATDFYEMSAPLTVMGGMDYYYKAMVVRQSSPNIYVQAVPEVYYDGRAHVAVQQELKPSAYKSSVNDLDIRVFDCWSPGSFDPGDSRELRYGKDYKVIYKNNKAASMKLESDGEGGYKYVKLDLATNKRPYVLITGLGGYKGFSTTVYFDIKPYNFGISEDVAQIDGLKHLYAFGTNGKITENVNPKVTLNIENKVTTLKNGRDFDPVIYKYDSVNIRWEKTTYKKVQEIQYAGDYLYTINGIGNFCGTAFGQDNPSEFADGYKGMPFNINPEACTYTNNTYKPCQFRVTDNKKYDLANAKITIGKSSLPYKNGSEGLYHAADFRITVKNPDGTEIDKSNYDLYFDGVNYNYVFGLDTSNGAFLTTENDCFYPDTDGIFIANKYAICIRAKGSNGYFGEQTTRKTVQIKGKSPGFKGITFLGGSSIKYDGTLGAGNIGKWTAVLSKCSVRPIGDDMDSILSSYGSTTSGTYKLYKYYEPENFIKFNYYYSQGIFTLLSKNPGSYNVSAYAIGPGTDHSRNAFRKYKRTAITMSEAMNNIITVTPYGDTYANAGGAMPGCIQISFGKGTLAKKYVISPADPGWSGYTWLGSLDYNNQAFTFSDGDPDPENISKTTIYLSASGNKGIGQGKLTIKGDGKLFKGAASVNYDIKPKLVPNSIKVLNGSDYAVSYGTKTAKIDVVSPGDEIGTIYAVCNPVKKTGSTPAPKNITLYQSYYKNQADAELRLASLAKIDPKLYKLTITSYLGSSNVYDVKVGIPDGKSSDTTGYDFATNNTALSERYGVFDEAARIVSITIKDTYDGDKLYTLPSDKPIADYTGEQIGTNRYVVTKVLLKGDIELPSFCYRVEYGSNVTAGKNGGLIRIILTPDTSTGTEYHYGGNATFYFEIKKKDTTTY